MASYQDAFEAQYPLLFAHCCKRHLRDYHYHYHCCCCCRCCLWSSRVPLWCVTCCKLYPPRRLLSSNGVESRVLVWTLRCPEVLLRGYFYRVNDTGSLRTYSRWNGSHVCPTVRARLCLCVCKAEPGFIKGVPEIISLVYNLAQLISSWLLCEMHWLSFWAQFPLGKLHILVFF